MFTHLKGYYRLSFKLNKFETIPIFFYQYLLDNQISLFSAKKKS
jgi:hypothetical protein